MRVALIDLLTMAPFYDRYLAEALLPLVDDLTLYAINFHWEKDYLASLRCKRATGALDLASNLGIRHVGLRRVIKLAEYVLNGTALLARWQVRPPDVVHLQWLPLLRSGDIELRFVAQLKRRGIPVVYTVHNILPHDSGYGQAVVERYHRLYHLADALIVHTAQDKQDLIAQFQVSPAQIYEIKQGSTLYDLPTPGKEEARQSLGWDAGWFVYLMLGVIRPYKGIEEALHALARLIPLYPQARLVVAGQGDSSYVSRLVNLAAELGIGGAVIWDLGFVPTGKVPVLHLASDVVLFPYRAISQSGALLTAAGLGCCILAASVGGLAEVIENDKTGILWSSQDPGGLADRMLYSAQLSPQQRQDMGRAARRRVLEEQSWAKIAQQTAQVYQRLLADTRRQ